MKYLKFLECKEFIDDFEKWSYCEITGISSFEEDEFYLVNNEELEQDFMKFFVEFHKITINEISNYPRSFEVLSDHEKKEYFDLMTMIIELIEIYYEYTAD